MVGLAWAGTPVYVCGMKRWAARPQERYDEWDLEQLFRESGPFFHLHTKPVETDVIFKSDAERAVALVYVAIAAALCGVEVLAYALMSNHFHFILRGGEMACRNFYGRFSRMLSLYFSRHGRPGVLDAVEEPDPTPITTLKQLRDEVAYVIRNPFVARTDVHAFAYPWCSGFLYFNPFLSMIPQRPAETLTLREKRALTRSRDLPLPRGLTVVTVSGPSRDTSSRNPQFLADGMVFPGSFVNYRLVETLFPDCRQFQFWVLKNVEAQVETALRLGENPSLTDDEMLSVSLRLCKQRFGQKGPSRLTEQQKHELAKQLKYDYFASNGQLARFTGLPLTTVNTLFPLSAKPRASKIGSG